METTEKKSLLLWTLTNMKDTQYVKRTMAGEKPIRHRAYNGTNIMSYGASATTVHQSLSV